MFSRTEQDFISKISEKIGEKNNAYTNEGAVLDSNEKNWWSV